MNHLGYSTPSLLFYPESSNLLYHHLLLGSQKPQHSSLKKQQTNYHLLLLMNWRGGWAALLIWVRTDSSLWVDWGLAGLGWLWLEWLISALRGFSFSRSLIQLVLMAATEFQEREWKYTRSLEICTWNWLIATSTTLCWSKETIRWAQVQGLD